MLQEIIPIALILIIGFSVNLHVEQFINKKKIMFLIITKP